MTTSNMQPVTNEQYTTLWTVMAILAVAIPAIAGYVSYSHTGMHGVGMSVTDSNH